ncbi:SDR family NAD(P)-dependent oxidoreductase [Streptomyces sp. NPDC047061]|uniref:SDR family NAD(P)-dependent oxidoreductase n=1 Tax=Streptomyces sp. NPDC047061 TaxID=3154605 RepID=UPI0033DEF783
MPILHRLTTLPEIEEFADSYERASGYRVAADYLKRGLVLGMRRRGRLIGGAVMTGEAPLRTFARIPEARRGAVEASVDPDDTIELACVWLDPEHRSGPRSLLFWHGLFREGAASGVRHAVFGTESRGLHLMYTTAGARVLYAGPVTVDGRHKDGWIYDSRTADRRRALCRLALYKTGLLRSRTPSGAGEHPAAPPPEVSRVQAGSAWAVPPRALTAAGRELLSGCAERLSGARRTRTRAHAALDAAALGGWALVTGASSGIGLAYARLLAARGAGLLLVADAPELTDIAAELRDAYAVRVDALVVDLAEERATDKVVAWVADRRVEVLVNNAGVGAKGRFTAGDPAGYLSMINVNLTSQVLLDRALLPAMAARGRGAVIHVASVNALAPVPYSAVYSATKTFVLTYATAVRHELRDRGVVFQVLLPGTTATPFHAAQHTELPRWAASPEKVAATSLERLGRQHICVSGTLNRAFRTVSGLLPLPARTAAAREALRASLGH